MRILILGFALAVLFSCQKESNLSFNDQLDGRWNWVSSEGGYAGWTITPETENKTSSIVFHENNFYEYFNDSLYEMIPYTINDTTSSLSQYRLQYEKVIHLERWDAPFGAKIDGNYLYLYELGYEHSFNRIYSRE